MTVGLGDAGGCGVVVCWAEFVDDPADAAGAGAGDDVEAAEEPDVGLDSNADAASVSLVTPA